jgi:hypothetical protein
MASTEYVNHSRVKRETDRQRQLAAFRAERQQSHRDDPRGQRLPKLVCQTRVPSKWRLLDLETMEVWRLYPEMPPRLRLQGDLELGPVLQAALLQQDPRIAAREALQTVLDHVEKPALVTTEHDCRCGYGNAHKRKSSHTRSRTTYEIAEHIRGLMRALQ